MGVGTSKSHRIIDNSVIDQSFSWENTRHESFGEDHGTQKLEY